MYRAILTQSGTESNLEPVRLWPNICVLIHATEDTRYGYAVGRLRALENALLDRSRYDRLVHQKDAAGLRAVLADTRYGPLLEETGGFPAALARAAGEDFAFLGQYCRDAWVLDLFRLEADVHNLKTVVKDRLLERETDDAELLGYGAWNRDALAALAAGQKKAEPAAFRGAVGKAVVRYLEDRDPSIVDVMLDREAHAVWVAAARENGFLKELVTVRADAENLRNLVRVRVLGEERALLEPVLFAGGTLKPRELLDLVGEEDAQLQARFRLTRYARMVEEGLAWLRDHRSLAKLERLGRELELAHLLRARYFTFGFEPLVAYYLMRGNEVANLRRLYAAKEARLPDEQCQEMVSHAG